MRNSTVASSIEPAVGVAELWPLATSAACSKLEPAEVLPRLTLASDALYDLRRRAGTRETAYFVGYHQHSTDYNIEDLQWTARARCELLIELRPNLRLDCSLARTEVLESCRVGHGDHRYAVAADYFRFLGSYAAGKESVRLTIQLTFPLCSFELRKLEKRLKIVGCPLAHDLCAAGDDFRSGFLTMDQSHRLLPVLADKALEFPLVGVWVAGTTVRLLPRSEDDHDYQSLVWAACVRYVTGPFRRVGSGPQHFLLMKFPKAHFAEVTLCPGAQWQSVQCSALVTAVTKDWKIDFSQVLKRQTGRVSSLWESSENPLRRSGKLDLRQTSLRASKASTMASTDGSLVRTSSKELARSQSTLSATPSYVSSSLEAGTDEDVPRYEESYDQLEP